MTMRKMLICSTKINKNRSHASDYHSISTHIYTSSKWSKNFVNWRFRRVRAWCQATKVYWLCQFVCNWEIIRVYFNWRWKRWNSKREKKITALKSFSSPKNYLKKKNSDGAESASKYPSCPLDAPNNWVERRFRTNQITSQNINL